MDCIICCDTMPENQMKQLECSHTLCMVCLSRLRTRSCPFCRHAITIPYIQSLLPTLPDTEIEPDASLYTQNIEGMIFQLYYPIPDLENENLIYPPTRRRRRALNRHTRTNTSTNNIPTNLSTTEVATIRALLQPQKEKLPPAKESISDRNRQKKRTLFSDRTVLRKLN